MIWIQRLRLTIRIICTVLFSSVMLLSGLLIRLVTRWKPGGFYRPICVATSIWGRGVAGIWGMKICIEGPRPEPPFMMISNHISYTDIVALCAVCPAWMVSKQEVSTWAGIGVLTRTALTVFINRETRRDVVRMNGMITDLVRQGGSVIFFPEGTTTDGNAVCRFKPSLFQPAIDLNLPVHIAAITYKTPEGSPPPESLVAWVGDDEFVPHALDLLASPGFTAFIRFADQPVQAEDRKTLASLAHERLTQTHRALRKDVL